MRLRAALISRQAGRGGRLEEAAEALSMSPQSRVWLMRSNAEHKHTLSHADLRISLPPSLPTPPSTPHPPHHGIIHTHGRRRRLVIPRWRQETRKQEDSRENVRMRDHWSLCPFHLLCLYDPATVRSPSPGVWQIGSLPAMNLWCLFWWSVHPHTTPQCLHSVSVGTTAQVTGTPLLKLSLAPFINGECFSHLSEATKTYSEIGAPEPQITWTVYLCPNLGWPKQFYSLRKWEIFQLKTRLQLYSAWQHLIMKADCENYK